MPVEAPPFPAMLLPAQRLARAWSAAFNAAGTDKAAYHLYRSLIVEVFPEDGVRLVCTNGSLLLRSWVPVWHTIDSEGDAFYDEPALSVEPTFTVVATDVAKRALGLMGFLSKAPSEELDDGRTEVVELTVGKIEQAGTQLTFESMGDTWGLLITAPRDQVCIPLLAGATAPDWRALYDAYDPADVQVAMFGQKNLRALTRVEGEAGSLEMRFQGDNMPILVKVDSGDDVVHGLLMPVRRDAPPPEDDNDTEPDDEPDEAPSFLDELGDDNVTPLRRRDLD